MKHLLLLLWVSIGSMLIPIAANSQGPGNALAKPDAQAPSDAPAAPAAQAPSDAPAAPAAQPAPVPSNGPLPDTIVGLPPVPNHEIFINGGTKIGTTVGSPPCLQQPCPPAVPHGLAVGVAGFTPAAAQVGTQTSTDTRFAFEAGFAFGFAKIRSFRLVGELPVVFNPSGDITSGNTLVARSYSSLFFTPALRIMYGPDSKTHPRYPPVYPWISLGGGLAHFSPSATNLAGGPSGAKSSTEGALQAGAGVDFGIYRKAIALRAEFRDFYTGPPNLGVGGINLRHNMIASAGIVFRFCKQCWGESPSDQKTTTSSPAQN